MVEELRHPLDTPDKPDGGCHVAVLGADPGGGGSRCGGCGCGGSGGCGCGGCGGCAGCGRRLGCSQDLLHRDGSGRRRRPSSELGRSSKKDVGDRYVNQTDSFNLLSIVSVKFNTIVINNYQLKNIGNES